MTSDLSSSGPISPSDTMRREAKREEEKLKKAKQSEERANHRDPEPRAIMKMPGQRQEAMPLLFKRQQRSGLATSQLHLAVIEQGSLKTVPAAGYGK